MALAALGSWIFLLIDYYGLGVRPLEATIRAAQATLSTATLVIAGLTRGRLSDRELYTLVVLALVPLWLSLSVSEQTGVLSGQPFTPFVGHKLLLFGVALLAPGPAWFGGGLIAGTALGQAVLWFALGMGQAPNIPADEPWASVTYALFGVVFYAQRLRHERMERALAHVIAEAAMLRRLASTFLTLRDQLNTPLQNLELAVGLLRRGTPPDAPLGAMSRALERLRMVRSTLRLEPDAEAELLQAQSSGDDRATRRVSAEP